MRLATVQSATTVRLEGATADSQVWRWGCPPTVGHIVATETFGTQLVVVASLTAPAASSVGLGAGLAALAAQSTTTGAFTTLSFPVVAFDDGDWIDGSSIVVPAAGRYLVTARAQFDGGNASGLRELYLRADGTSTLAQLTTPACAYWAGTVSCVRELAAGTVVTAAIEQSSGATVSVLATRTLEVVRLA